MSGACRCFVACAARRTIHLPKMFGLVVVCAIALTWTPTASAATISVISGNGLIGSTDPNVTVTDSCAGTTTQATIVPPYSDSGGYWIDPIGNSQWDSVNAGSHGCNGTYQATFTLPADGASPSLTVTDLADNSTNVSVNGNQPFITGNVPGQCVNAYDGPPVSGTTTSGLVPGVNTLTFNVDNCYPADGVNPTGVDFVATVTYDTAGGSGSGPTGGSSPPTITVDHNPQSLSPTEEEVSGHVNGCFVDQTGQPPGFFTEYATPSDPQNLENLGPPQGPLIWYDPNTTSTTSGMWCPNSPGGQGIGGVINGLVPGTGYVYRFTVPNGSLADLITSDSWFFVTPGAPQAIPPKDKTATFAVGGGSAGLTAASCALAETGVGAVFCGAGIVLTVGTFLTSLDPSDPHYSHLFTPASATAPSLTSIEHRCGRVAHKTCFRIARATRAFVFQAAHFGAVSEALAVTCDRFSGAVHAHNRRGQRRQRAWAFKLFRTWSSDLPRYRRAARRMANALRGTRLDTPFTAAQLQSALQRVESGRAIPGKVYRRLRAERLVTSRRQLGGLLGFGLPQTASQGTLSSLLLAIARA
jgi:hypothetical protein